MSFGLQALISVYQWAAGPYLNAFIVWALILIHFYIIGLQVLILMYQRATGSYLNTFWVTEPYIIVLMGCRLLS